MKAKAGFSGGLDLPFSVSLGPAHVGLAPGFEASLTKGGAFDAFGLSGKAGLWLSGPTFRLGASGKLGPTLSVADLPCAAALEGRIVLDPSPLVLWGSALVDFQFGTIGATRPSIPVFKLIGGLGLLM